MKQVAWGYVPNEDRILIATRIKKDDSMRSGQFVLPGGGLEDKESYIQAAIREVFEETGINTPQSSYFLINPRFGNYDKSGLNARVESNGLIILEYTDSGKMYRGRIIGLRPEDPKQTPLENPLSDAKEPRYADKDFIYENIEKFTPACQVLLEIMKNVV